MTSEARDLDWEGTSWSLDDERPEEVSSCGTNFFRSAAPANQVTGSDTWVECLFPQPSIRPLTSNRISGSTNQHYQRAYEEVSESSTEHLSNAEWTALRIRRDRQLRRLQNIQNQQDSEEEPVVRHRQEEFIESFIRDRESNAIRWQADEDEQSLFDREVLLFDEGHTENSVHHSNTRYRTGARQMPVSTQAQTERLSHRSVSLLANTLRRIRPWRAFAERPEAAHAPHDTEAYWTEQDDDSSGEELSFVSPSGFDSIITAASGSSTSSQAFDTTTDDERNTGYWSSGTAMETDCDSISSHGSGDYIEIASLDPQQHPSIFEEAIMSSPSSVEPNVDNLSPRRTADLLFPEDPFEALSF